MALAVETGSGSGKAEFASSYSNAGVNLGASSTYLAVSVLTEGQRTISPTWNSVSLTAVANTRLSRTNSFAFVDDIGWWELQDPATGTHTLSVGVGELTAFIGVCWIPFSGEDGTTPSAGGATNSSDSAQNATVSPTGGAAGDIQVAATSVAASPSVNGTRIGTVQENTNESTFFDNQRIAWGSTPTFDQGGVAFHTTSGFVVKAASVGGGGATQPPRSMHQFNMRRAA